MPAAAALAEPPVLRRRPVYLVGGLLAVALGAVLAGWLFSRSGSTQLVLGVREPVARGEVIEVADLLAVDVIPDPALRPVPWTERQQVLGQRATVDLAAGGLLVEGSYSAEALPAPGQSLVGVWLTPGQLPGTALRPGDPVRVVATPRAQDDLPAARPKATQAVVVSVDPATDGHTLVTVSVPAAGAAQLSALAATGRVALVADSMAR